MMLLTKYSCPEGIIYSPFFVFVPFLCGLICSVFCWYRPSSSRKFEGNRRFLPITKAQSNSFSWLWDHSVTHLYWAYSVSRLSIIFWHSMECLLFINTLEEYCTEVVSSLHWEQCSSRRTLLLILGVGATLNPGSQFLADYDNHWQMIWIIALLCFSYKNLEQF